MVQRTPPRLSPKMITLRPLSRCGAVWATQSGVMSSAGKIWFFLVAKLSQKSTLMVQANA